MTKKRGMLIVIDGTDGTGKATQIELLTKKFLDKKIKVRVADFPQYGEKSAGLVEEYLNGKYGTAEEVGPYIGSIFYAVDRYAASFKIKKWIKDGEIVLCNRYVTANMGHQGGKIKDTTEREKYLKWLYDLEYNLFGIPKPDINIILHVSPETGQKNVDKKGHRDYIGEKTRDIHESNINHLIDAEKVYLEIAQTFDGFVLINCEKNGKMLDRETICALIWIEIMKHNS